MEEHPALAVSFRTQLLKRRGSQSSEFGLANVVPACCTLSPPPLCPHLPALSQLFFSFFFSSFGSGDLEEGRDPSTPLLLSAPSDSVFTPLPLLLPQQWTPTAPASLVAFVSFLNSLLYDSSHQSSFSSTIKLHLPIGNPFNLSCNTSRNEPLLLYFFLTTTTTSSALAKT